MFPVRRFTFNGAQIDVVGTPADGDTFTVSAPSTQDMFTTINKLVQGLTSLSDSADDKQRLNDLVSETLDNIDSAETNISTIQAKVGARLNILQSTGDLQDGVGLVNQQVLSQVRDLDYASAISQLTKQNVVLQAAQQSFAKISSLSLFDFLKIALLGIIFNDRAIAARAVEVHANRAMSLANCNSLAHQ